MDSGFSSDFPNQARRRLADIMAKILEGHLEEADSEVESASSSDSSSSSSSCGFHEIGRDIFGR
eukprot:10895347-Karenia_brevis.AAC.1